MARELLIIQRLLGPVMSKTFFKGAVTTMSRGQDAGFMIETIFVREGSKMSWKRSNLEK